MPTKWKVRVEKVAFVEVEITASTGLVARHAVMQMIDDGELKVRARDWHDDGLQVEGAVEVEK